MLYDDGGGEGEGVGCDVGRDVADVYVCDGDGCDVGDVADVCM